MSYQDVSHEVNNSNQHTPCVVLITCPSQQEAEKIARILVEEHLAACVNIIQIQSIYRWNNNVCNDPEWQLIIKTDMKKISALESKVIDIHPYELPEVVAIPIIQGYTPYLKWIAQEVDLANS